MVQWFYVVEDYSNKPRFVHPHVLYHKFSCFCRSLPLNPAHTVPVSELAYHHKLIACAGPCNIHGIIGAYRLGD
ncbi:MAG: hypothetical protein EPN94_05290 [Nitrospirae bacterium]|nr:MAG: hypothetical protein EPN94_05290 [Nitrospirota bacterium]